MSIVDLWLKMNVCEKDFIDDIYFVGGDDPIYVGHYNGCVIVDGVAIIDITMSPEQAGKFLEIKVVERR